MSNNTNYMYLNIKKPMTTTKFTHLQWLLFLLLVFCPKFVLSSIPGLSSTLRVDLLLSLFYLVLFFTDMARKRLFLERNGGVLIIICLLLFAYIANSKNALVAIGQCMLYLSLLVAFFHGASINGLEYESKVRILRFFLFLNILIHFVFVFFDIETYAGVYTSDSGTEDPYDIFGKYGVSGIPFQFSIYIAAFVFLLMHGGVLNKGIKITGLLAAFVALLTGDSRISFVALMLSFLGLKTILIVPPLISLSYIVQTKSISVVSNFQDIFEDKSLSMRLLNLDGYFDWLSVEKMIFGGGAQSFLEFSVQYGLPGPLDMGYIRIASEFGVFGALLLAIFALQAVGKRFVISMPAEFRDALMFCAIYTILNEGLLAARSGHLMLFVVGLLYFSPRTSSFVQLIKKSPSKINQ